MKVEETALPEVLLLSPTIYLDGRGVFFQTWNQRAMADARLPAHWVQDNFSISKKNVLRGIHYQVIQPQGKIMRVVYGAALDRHGGLERRSSRRHRPLRGWHRARADGSTRQDLFISFIAILRG